MKKRITMVDAKKHRDTKKAKKRKKNKQPGITTGIDLGDHTSAYHQLDGDCNFVESGSVRTTAEGFKKQFAGEPRMRIVMEAGTHSAWVAELLTQFGHEVIVANPRAIPLISNSTRKNDDADAELLARLGRVDPKLLKPIKHRGAEAREHMLLIRARAAIVEARTKLVNAVRGLAKNMGERISSFDTDQMTIEKLAALPESMRHPLTALAACCESLTEQIKECDKRIEQIAAQHYPEVRYLTQISGVGTLIALTFILTIDDPNRFAKSRDVGCYIGLRPKQRESGESQPQLGISKEGDAYLRKMLVQAAHCVMSRRAPETDLKRWGAKLASRGGGNGKKRALVAVARKLGILMHRLWVDQAVYEPNRHNQPIAKAA